MNECVIVDIDGTLADCGHRLGYLKSSPKNWKAYLDPGLVVKDRLIEPVSKVVLALQATYPVIFASGRPDSLRESTEEWLIKHGLWSSPFLLYMRGADDFRKDYEVKREILQAIRAAGYLPFLTIDDRSSVVAMWREEGLICMQVAEGDY